MPLALVTGANRGIGLGVARHLARAGYDVLAGSRSLDKGTAAVEQLRRDVPEASFRAVQLDVTSEDDAREVARLIDAEYGGTLHALVNNAGVDYDTDQRVLTADLERVRRAWETNTLGPWRLCQVLATAIKAAGAAGRIVNVTSGGGAFGSLGAGTPAYSHSKAALNAVTVMLAAGFRDSGTRVNACGPGWVRTDMGGMGASRSVEQGASSIAWGVTGVSDDGPTGGYFYDGEPQAW